MAAPSKYDKKKNEEVITLMKEGGSMVEVAALLGITRTTLYDWINPESSRFKEELSNTIKRGVDLAEAWWVKQGRVNLTNKDFNATLFYMNMKNRFGWKDKQETQHTIEDNTLRVIVENMSKQ
jgi:predicted transcriptional regulator